MEDRPSLALCRARTVAPPLCSAKGSGRRRERSKRKLCAGYASTQGRRRGEARIDSVLVQEQRARSLSRDRAALAVASERLLTPRMSPRLSPRLGAYGGAPAASMQSLSHRRSWHGGYPGQVNIGHAPTLLPHGHSHSPQLFPLGTHTAGLPAVGQLAALGSRSRSPSTGRVLVSPRIGHPPSPRVVNYNHNTYNISPHHHGHHEVLAGGLGALDDLHLGAGAVDPVLLDDYAGVPTYPPQDFVVTDAGLVEGRRIRELLSCSSNDEAV